ncbi:MAG: hypothetical protein U5N56_07265 [Candidatus Marinimicrobia bacterium]|nr:hypothetical protein [Candidatus Neomarinimicrobiota bacterium]
MINRTNSMNLSRDRSAVSTSMFSVCMIICRISIKEIASPLMKSTLAKRFIY